MNDVLRAALDRIEAAPDVWDQTTSPVPAEPGQTVQQATSPWSWLVAGPDSDEDADDDEESD